MFYEGGADTTILLGIEDVTAQRVLEREKDELLKEKDVLFEELQHRVSNSLQIIASILLMKARVVQSEETRFHLQDAHKRVLSVAAVQKQLHASGATGSVEIAPYLTKLCESLATSMIGDTRPILLKVVGEAGSASSREAESLGLIVTEVVMNALKHAFPDDKANGQIIVAYDRAGTNWKLSISDNGVGKSDGVLAYEKSGLGTGIIKALSNQLDAQVETLTGPDGTTVSITHTTLPATVARLGGGNSPHGGVRFLEAAHDTLGVVAAFRQGFGVPFAPLGREKVAAIDMDRTGQARNRIGHRVNDVVAERFGVADAQERAAGGLDPAASVRQTAPEDVVLAAAVDADHRPHLMIMRHDRHHRSPDDVEDREVVRVIELLDFGALRLADAFEHGGGLGDRARDDLAHQPVRRIGGERRAAILGEASRSNMAASPV